MNVLNPFNNPDLAREILSYERSSLPRLASVSQIMNMISQERLNTYIRWMDKVFPLWYLTADIIRDQGYDIINPGGQAYEIVLYQMQRAAINKQWDALRVMANYHADDWQHLLDVIMIVHVNNNIPLAKSMFQQYRDRFPPLDQFPYSIIHFYTLQEDPSTLSMIKKIFMDDIKGKRLTPDTAILTTRELVSEPRTGYYNEFIPYHKVWNDYIYLLATRQLPSVDESIRDSLYTLIADSMQWNQHNLANVIGDVDTPLMIDDSHRLAEFILTMKYHNTESLARLEQLIDINNRDYIESLIVLKSLGKKMGIDYIKRIVAVSAAFYRIVGNDLQDIPITLESIFGDKENEDV